MRAVVTMLPSFSFPGFLFLNFELKQSSSQKTCDADPTVPPSGYINGENVTNVTCCVVPDV